MYCNTVYAGVPSLSGFSWDPSALPKTSTLNLQAEFSAIVFWHLAGRILDLLACRTRSIVGSNHAEELAVMRYP